LYEQHYAHPDDCSISTSEYVAAVAACFNNLDPCNTLIQKALVMQHRYYISGIDFFAGEVEKFSHQAEFGRGVS